MKSLSFPQRPGFSDAIRLAVNRSGKECSVVRRFGLLWKRMGPLFHQVVYGYRGPRFCSSNKADKSNSQVIQEIGK
jgi:hypothetical protein